MFAPMFTPHDLLIWAPPESRHLEDRLREDLRLLKRNVFATAPDDMMHSRACKVLRSGRAIRRGEDRSLVRVQRDGGDPDDGQQV